MSDTANITLRAPVELIDRIDNAAATAGISRTQYVLSWLPVTYDQPTPRTATSANQPADKGQQRHRVASSQQRSSPAHD